MAELVDASVLLAAYDRTIAKLEAMEAAETASINRMIASHSIGEGSGFWKTRHRLREQCRVAHAMREALAQELPLQP